APHVAHTGHHTRSRLVPFALQRVSAVLPEGHLRLVARGLARTCAARYGSDRQDRSWRARHLAYAPDRGARIVGAIIVASASSAIEHQDPIVFAATVCARRHERAPADVSECAD